MTDRYVVAGNPVEHSLSPAIHAAFARQTGHDIDYGRLLCPLDAFVPTLRAFAADPSARGCNVTVPFKFEAFALAGRHSERAALAGAVNTLRFDAGGWFGDNTDGIGLLRDLEQNAGFPIVGRQVLLIGAGGAAAGVLGPLLGARPARLVISNRTPERAEHLVEQHRLLARETRLEALSMAAAGDGFDLVINATASSLQGEAVTLRPGQVRDRSLAVDLMYGPKSRPFLDAAARLGAATRDGLGMLVEQAAEAFLVWRGVRPDTRAVLAQLRERIDATT
jgi:shikimate dehydrogenase